MPTLANPHRTWPAKISGPSASDRFTRALVGLTRTVWHHGSSFETTIAATCEAAAKAMLIDRVSVWHYDREAGLLRCLHAYEAAGERHAAKEELETLSLEGDDYMAALQDVRTLDASDLKAEGDTTSYDELRDYLRRHRIRNLLDAPACVEGELLAVVSHESIDRLRRWSQEEVTFAASIGDYIAMAYETVRRNRAEQEVEHLRLHDTVTGLPNRDYMVEATRQRMATPRTPGEVLGVVHVDIDASGGVSLPAETQTVDEVMAHVAQRLRRFINKDIELARVRANGFAFLLACTPSKRAVIRLAENALSAVQALGWQPRQIDPSAAVGIAFAEPTGNNDARVLLRQAEEAAARAGTGTDKYRYEVFDPEHHDALVKSLHFERTLRDAFANDEFELHYQPEYDASGQEWVAAEALLRWRDGERIVGASDFIEVAESCGLILPLGSWVLQRACMDATQWPKTSSGVQPAVRVNVSGRQLDEGRLVEEVRAALAASGLQPARLSLEITETALMRDIEHAEHMLRELKARGVGLAIDDFGTGYASLTYLKRLPVNVLKIDRSFVECMIESSVDAAIVQAVVGLARSLEIDVIAEGVETKEQQQALKDIGVRRMQGWLYGKAMDQAAICSLLGSAFN
jgi:diguanylate cyclase (GGDEF)-like protein